MVMFSYADGALMILRKKIVQKILLAKIVQYVLGTILEE